jgi:hypothetical protein
MPRNATVQEHMGDILAKRGRWADAIAAWTARCRGTKATSTKRPSRRRSPTLEGRCADKSRTPNSKVQLRFDACRRGLGIWVLGFLITACAKPHITLPTDAACRSGLQDHPHAAVVGLHRRAYADGGNRSPAVPDVRNSAAGRRGFARPDRCGSKASRRLVLRHSSSSRADRMRRCCYRVTSPRTSGARTGRHPRRVDGRGAGSADLQAILTGCVVPAPQATDGAATCNGWASIDLSGGATLYVQRLRRDHPHESGVATESGEARRVAD